jgi:hypothetical protein
MNRTLTILNPELGGRIRGILNTVFAVFILLTQYWSELGEQGWAGTVVKVYAFLIALVQILTHGTQIGNEADDR